MSDTFEICEISFKWTKGGGLFRNPSYVFVVKNVTNNSIITTTNDIKRENDFREGDPILRALLNNLMTQGWEQVGEEKKTIDLLPDGGPGGSNVGGDVITLRKRLTQSSGTSQSTDLLKQLKALCDADILTEAEYTAKKAEILQRM